MRCRPMPGFLHAPPTSLDRMENETTPGGSIVYRHDSVQPHDAIAPVNAERRGMLEEHLVSFLGEPLGVLQEIVADGIQLDLLVFPPSKERPLYTIVTEGMSDVAMNVPEGVEDLRFCELVMTLPADWPMNQEAWEDEVHYWPVRLLKNLARIPVTFDSWLSYGHSVLASENPDDLIEGSDFHGSVLLFPMTFAPEQVSVAHGDDTIHLWGVYPLYADELEFKLEHGADPLLEAFQARHFHEGVLPGRSSVVAR